jgi:GTP-binding protein
LVAVSAEHGRGIDELVAAMVKQLQPPEEQSWAEQGVRASIAVIGRPNVGKSSLLNRLVGEERHLATPIAGTTRDSIDSFVDRSGKRYRFIDTAGLRRKARISERLEEYMVVSALRSLESADVVVLVLDATEPFTDQDAKIAALAHDRGKGIVLAVNKWDLPHDQLNPRNLKDEIDHTLPFLSYARVLYMSVKTGQGVDQLFKEIEGALDEREKRISTGELNRLIEKLYDEHEPVYRAGKRGKIYYVTQVAVSPPTFIFAVNDPDRFDEGYKRYLTNALRKHHGFEGTPIVIKFRRRHKAADDVEHEKRKTAKAGGAAKPFVRSKVHKGGTGKKGQGRHARHAKAGRQRKAKR